ncbi:MAG: fasciclin domain-containing protein [Planctomycetota bacterium]
MRTALILPAVAMAGFLSLATPARAQTITDIVAASGGEGMFDSNRFDYDILLNAVLAADLAGALGDPTASFTVFAPNDLAFVRLARDLGYAGTDESGAWSFLVSTLTDLGGGDPIPLLTNVLLYHVVPEEVTPFQLILLTLFDEEIPTLLSGATIDPFFFVLRDNEPGLSNPRVTFPFNVLADNGRIHTINRVLIPVALL